MMLKNSKHEQFAHEIAKGLPLKDAYILVYDSEKGAYQSASRLLKRPDVAARVEEIKINVEKRIEDKIGVSKAWVIEKLRENLDRALQTIPVLDRDGKPTGEFTYQGGVANKALELIGKELGMFKEQIEHSGPATLKVIYEKQVNMSGGLA